MGNARNTWRVEITQASPVAQAGPAPVDVTSRVQRDGFGYINRAMERNLLSFKTGDLTLVTINRDGFFDAFFADLDPTQRWTIRVFRRSMTVPIFAGVLMGLGSIRFNRREKTCEITAYGLTRILADASAEPASRTST